MQLQNLENLNIEKNRLQNLTTQYLGRDFHYFEKLESTQAEIWRRIENNTIKNGSLILTDFQTSRNRNTWKKMVNRRKGKHYFFFLLRNKL